MKKSNIFDHIRDFIAHKLFTNNKLTNHEDRLIDIEVNGVGGSTYVHPSTHPAEMISQSDSRQFITLTEKNRLAGLRNYTHPATHSADVIEATDSKIFFTPAERLKLQGLENYTHPNSHSATIIVETASRRFATDTEKAKWNGIDTISSSVNDIMRRVLLLEGNDIYLDFPALKGRVDTIESTTVLNASRIENINTLLGNLETLVPFTNVRDALVSHDMSIKSIDTRVSKTEVDIKANQTSLTDLKDAFDQLSVGSSEASQSLLLEVKNARTDLLGDERTTLSERLTVDFEKILVDMNAMDAEVVEARTDFFGTPHNSLSERISVEFEIIASYISDHTSDIEVLKDTMQAVISDITTINNEVVSVAATVETKMNTADSYHKDVIDTMIQEAKDYYVHPQTHPASMIVETDSKKFISATELSSISASAAEISTIKTSISTINSEIYGAKSRLDTAEETITDNTSRIENIVDEIEEVKYDYFGNVYSSIDERIEHIEMSKPQYTNVMNFPADENGVITTAYENNIEVLYNYRMGGKTIKDSSGKLISWGNGIDDMILTVTTEDGNKSASKELWYIDEAIGKFAPLVLRATLDGSVKDRVYKTGEAYNYYKNIKELDLYDLFFDIPSFTTDRNDDVFQFSIELPLASESNNYISCDYGYTVPVGNYFTGISDVTDDTIAVAKQGRNIYMYSRKNIFEFKEYLLANKIYAHYVLIAEEKLDMTCPVLELFPGINKVKTNMPNHGEFITSVSGDIHRLWKNSLDRIHDCEDKIFKSASRISALNKTINYLMDIVEGHDPFFAFVSNSLMTLVEKDIDRTGDITQLLNAIFGDIYPRIFSIESLLGIDSGEGVTPPIPIPPRPTIVWKHEVWAYDNSTIFFTTESISAGGFSQYDMEGAGLSENPNVQQSGIGYYQLNWGFINSFVRINKSWLTGYNDNLSVETKISLFNTWWRGNVRWRG